MEVIKYSFKYLGQQKYFEARIFPTAGETFLIVIRDISEEQRSKQNLLIERIKSEKSKSLSILAGGIAHDFNNFLTTIMGCTNLLRLEEGISSEGQEILTDLEEAVKEATSLANQLLIYSKPSTPNKKEESIFKIITRAISLTMRGSKSKCITDFADVNPNIIFDPNQLLQVCSNLLINAQQAMETGGIITISVADEQINEKEFLFLSPGLYLRIDITDQGKGIPIKQQEFIFQPYHTTKEEGTGLGLATSYMIVKNHGGVLTFHTEINKGTTFSVYLPK